MKQKVIRKTLAGEWETFKFEDKSRFFFVKNFTDGDIYVSLKEGCTEEESIKIKSGVGEEVAINYGGADIPLYKTDSVFVKGTGEVEVQALD